MVNIVEVEGDSKHSFDQVVIFQVRKSWETSFRRFFLEMKTK
jgi:hypothetical protein